MLCGNLSEEFCLVKMVDRFDGRALLDFYKDPVPGQQRKTADEMMLDEVEESPLT